MSVGILLLSCNEAADDVRLAIVLISRARVANRFSRSEANSDAIAPQRNNRNLLFCKEEKTTETC